MSRNTKEKTEFWEIWNGKEYLGTTSSLQIVEVAVERGLKVIKVV